MVGNRMKSSYALSPPIIIRVGNSHWRSPQTVVLELESERPQTGVLPFRQFRLLMNGVVVYKGGGYGIEKFGDYVTFPEIPEAPQEIRLNECLIDE